MGPALGLMAVSTVRVGDQATFMSSAANGSGKDFLHSLVLPAGMRALLYLNLDPNFQAANLVDAAGTVRAKAIASRLHRAGAPAAQRANIQDFAGRADPASAEAFHALPLLGRQKELLGVLLVGSSQHDVVTLERRIRVPRAGRCGHGLLLRAPAELVGSGARDAAGAEVGRRRARSLGRELERARGRSRPQRNWPAGERVQSHDRRS